MRYALDPSVSLAGVLPRPHSPKAARLLDDYRHQIHELIAPSVYSAEVASGLTKAERQKLIQPGEARKFFLALLKYPPVLHDYEPLLLRAIDISSLYRAGLYDCLYVALAEREGCELVTADQRAINNLSPHFAFILPLSALP
jgi:predicted nucleic acid-binding protein